MNNGSIAIGAQGVTSHLTNDHVEEVNTLENEGGDEIGDKLFLLEDGWQ